MKALVIILAVLLVIGHPWAVAAVLSAETAVVAGLGLLTMRALRSALLPPVRRRAAA